MLDTIESNHFWLLSAKLLLNLKWKGLEKFQGANFVNYFFIVAYLVFLMGISCVALSTNSMINYHDSQNVTVFDPTRNKNVIFDYTLCGISPGSYDISPFHEFCSLDTVYDYMKVRICHYLGIFFPCLTSDSK